MNKTVWHEVSEHLKQLGTKRVERAIAEFCPHWASLVAASDDDKNFEDFVEHDDDNYPLQIDPATEHVVVATRDLMQCEMIAALVAVHDNLADRNATKFVDDQDVEMMPPLLVLAARVETLRNLEGFSEAVRQLIAATNGSEDDKKGDTQTKSKKRRMNADAACCARLFKQRRRTDDSTKMKHVVEEYADEHDKSSSSIIRVLNDNPDQWKDDK